ncbi:MAG: GNAT family N-acetyltransferase [Deltaproteobacteria bacterium]|nr:GNAT family N-acetyltransferase [Nannocystaceae bacterium]
MIEIRAATLEDAPALWRAEVETASVPGQLVSRPHELTLPAFEQRIEELRHSGSYVVAADAGVLCGHALLEPMSLDALRHIFRLTLVVHARQTGRGVGTALLRHLQRWAASSDDLHKVELLVRANNSRALQLYGRLGFIEEGRLRDRIRLPDGSFLDDIAMAWFPRAAPG